MKTTKVRRFKVLAIPLMALAVALLLMLSWGHQSTQQAEANDATTNFQISTASVNVPVNGSFKVTLDMAAVGSLAGTINLWQGVIGWTPGLTGPGDPSSTKTVTLNGCAALGAIGATAAPWLATARRAGAACSAFNPPILPDASMLKGGGLNASFQLNCGPNPSAETVTMIINAGAKGQFTHVGDGLTDTADLGGSETLNINCVAPPAVGGLATDLDGEQGGLALDTAQSSGGNAGLLAGLIAGISAAAIAVTGAAWYARRRWLA